MNSGNELELAESHILKAIEIVKNYDPNLENIHFFNFNLGLLYLTKEEWNKAEAAFLNAMEGYSKKNAGNKIRVSEVKSYLAEVFVHKSQFDKVRQIVEEVYPIIIENYHENHEARKHIEELKKRCETDCKLSPS